MAYFPLYKVMTQPQLERLTFEPIIRIHAGEVPEMLGRLAAGDPFAFITQTGTSNPDFLPQYHNEIQELGFRDCGMGAGPSSDIGWHDDGDVTPPLPVHVIHDHFTINGTSQVEMVVQHTTPDDMEARVEVLRQLEEGLVNPTIFATRGLAANLYKGDRIFFAVRGQQKIKHRFTTISAKSIPRRTSIRVLAKGY